MNNWDGRFDKICKQYILTTQIASIESRALKQLYYGVCGTAFIREFNTRFALLKKYNKNF